MSEISGTFPWPAAITRHMRDAGADVEPSDPVLMRRVAGGDREAFAAIYRRYHAAVFRFARLMTGSSTMAEDVVQEVFLVLMHDAARYSSDRASLSTYLYGIARRHTRRRLVRERRFVAIEDECAAPGPASTRDAGDALVLECELSRLRRSILALPSRYREVVVLCDLQDLPYAEAAGTLGCAVGTVRSRLHRARQLLARKMRRSGECPAGAVHARMRCAV